MHVKLTDVSAPRQGNYLITVLKHNNGTILYSDSLNYSDRYFFSERPEDWDWIVELESLNENIDHK